MKRYHKNKAQKSVAIFTLITIGLFLLVISMRDRTEIALVEHVQLALDLHEEGMYTVQEPIHLLNSISSMGDFFSVVNNQNVTMQACVIRIMGISGPVASVFLHSEQNTEFIGVVGYIDDTKNSLHGLTSSQILYWENTITQAFSDYLTQENIE